MKPSVMVTSTWSGLHLPVGRVLSASDAHGDESQYPVFPVAGAILLADSDPAYGMYMLDLSRGVVRHRNRPEFLCAKTMRGMAVYDMWINQAKAVADQRVQLTTHMPGGKLPLIAVSACGVWFHIGNGVESMWLCATRMQKLQPIDNHRFAATFKFARHTIVTECYHPHVKFAVMNRIWRYCVAVDTILAPVWRRILPVVAPGLLNSPRFNTRPAPVESLPDDWIEAAGKGDADAIKELLLARMNENFDIIGSNAQLMSELFELLFGQINESGESV